MPLYDMVIVGGGPAGLTAGIYGARAKLKTIILEKGKPGGQAYTTRELVNYPGFFRGTTGPKLMEVLVEHAKEFGTQIIQEEVIDIEFKDGRKVVKTRKGNRYEAKAIVLAPGAEPRLLNIKGEKALRGKGVSYCATCDAEFYDGLDVVVVGNGDAAIEEALFLTKFASKVKIVVIHDEGIVDCNKLSAEKAFKHPKIEFIWNSVLEEIKGKDEVESVVIKNLKTGILSEVKTSGVFIYIGMVPRTEFLKNKIEMTEDGYIIVNEQMETSVEGVFAAGDARVKYLRQVLTAANDGAIAAVAAERFIAEEESFKEQVLKADRPVLIVFWSPTDERSFEVISNLEKIVLEVEGKVKLVKIDISRKQKVARRYNILKTPAVILIEDGKIIKSLFGTLDEASIKRQLISAC